MNNVLMAENITKYYGILNKKKILNQVSIYLNSGECVCIVGQNGVGKSTLLKIICNIIPKRSGKLTRSGKLGYVPETSINFQNLNGFQNMEYYDTVLKGHRLYPELFNEMELPITKKPLKKFSKGMKRKLDLIRAINLRPEILILDEPFEGIDPSSIRDMLSVLMKEKSKGTGILMSSHDMSYIEKIADRVLLLKDSALKELVNWKKEIKMFLVKGDLGSIHNSLKEFNYTIDEAEGNYKITIIDKIDTFALLTMLVKNEITIIREEVKSLEDIFLQEIQNNDS